MSASNLPIFRKALEWGQAGRAVAIACVVETWGSAPRPPGSRLVVDADGNFSGSVSGGCVEAEVIGAALEAMQADVPGFIGFAVGRTSFWDPLVAWRDGKIQRQQAVEEIARRYLEWVEVFEDMPV